MTIDEQKKKINTSWWDRMKDKNTNLKLSIKDLGPIKNAEIPLNQINVVGGPNSGGKTFTSKILFSFLNSLKEANPAKSDTELEEILKTLLKGEFGKNYKKLLMRSSIELNDDSFNIRLEDGNRLNFNLDNELKAPYNEIIYMDSVSLMNFKFINDQIKIGSNSLPYHFYSLMERLSRNKEKTKNENDYFIKRLNKIMDGSFEFNRELKEFNFKSNNKLYDMFNVASGYKQLGILELLLANNCLKEGTLLILDEPEVNLHPGIQVELGEILVKMVKELNISLYINSHSPYLIESIEVYFKKEELFDKTNFILCEEYDSGKFNIFKIEDKDIDDIYDNLGDPYNIIEDVRFEIEWKKDFE